MPGWSEASRPGAPDGAPPKETTLSECARRTAACAPGTRRRLSEAGRPGSAGSPPARSPNTGRRRLEAARAPAVRRPNDQGSRRGWAGLPSHALKHTPSRRSQGRARLQGGKLALARARVAGCGRARLGPRLRTGRGRAPLAPGSRTASQQRHASARPRTRPPRCCCGPRAARAAQTGRSRGAAGRAPRARGAARPGRCARGPPPSGMHVAGRAAPRRPPPSGPSPAGSAAFRRARRAARWRVPDPKVWCPGRPGAPQQARTAAAAGKPAAARARRRRWPRRDGCSAAG